MKRLQRSASRRSGFSKKINDCVTSSEETPSEKQKKNFQVWNSIPEIPEDETEEKLMEKGRQLKRLCRSSRPDQSEIQKLTEQTSIKKEAHIGADMCENHNERLPTLLSHQHMLLSCIYNNS